MPYGAVVQRGDPLCPACTQAAQKTVSWPLWLFDSPLLRRALAQLNVPAVPAIVRAACGLSQRDLAGIVGWSPAALSYYERGQRDAVFDIRAVLQFADALGMPRAALLPWSKAVPPTTRSRTYSASAHACQYRRRELLTPSGAPTAGRMTAAAAPAARPSKPRRPHPYPFRSPHPLPGRHPGRPVSAPRCGSGSGSGRR